MKIIEIFYYINKIIMINDDCLNKAFFLKESFIYGISSTEC
jgi:hypothetical protein